MITADIIDNELSSNSNHAPETPPSGSAKLNEWMEAYLSDYFGSFGDQLPPPGLYDRVLRDVEAPLITAALAATRGNQIKAAELLGLEPQHATQEGPGAEDQGHSQPGLAIRGDLRLQSLSRSLCRSPSRL